MRYFVNIQHFCLSYRSRPAVVRRETPYNRLFLRNFRTTFIIVNAKEMKISQSAKCFPTCFFVEIRQIVTPCSNSVVSLSSFGFRPIFHFKCFQIKHLGLSHKNFVQFIKFAKLALRRSFVGRGCASYQRLLVLLVQWFDFSVSFYYSKNL